LSEAEYPVFEVVSGKIVPKSVPALTALNERLRDDYIEEIADGVARWQRVIDNAGIPFRLNLPHKASIAKSAISRDTSSAPKEKS